jgi:serine/threonine protein kinase/tetratricopeptide (TPR) repeat protein
MTNRQTPSIDEVFFAAMERESPEARAAYLDDVCASDPELRRQVERLLEAQHKVGSFLDGPAAGATVSLALPQTMEGPGAVIGPYKLLEQIGEGGMGVVYMAEQTQPVRRKVALKIIKPGMDTKQVIARFEAERQALALMDHPNIAKVLDAGTTESGRPYFVMELVKGIPITEYCDQHRLSIRERLGLFTQVCQAVQHAHQKGIIHRDIKPSNVLVTSLDGVPLPRVIDFGIAKATGQSLTDKTLFTGFAQLIGTPLYMSPEQAELSAADVDTRSDIYSLGVLLYELLTGTTPFDQDTFRTAALDEVRRIIREDEPPKPSTRLSGLGPTLTTISENRQTDARKLNRSIRGELDWIVMKALEKERSRRYESASGLARDVERYLTGDPIEAGPPSGWYRLSKFARRNRMVLTATVLVALSLVAGTTVSVWQAMLAQRARADAIAQRDEARQAVDDMYTDVADQWLKQHAALEPMQRKFLQKALDYYLRFAGDRNKDPKVRSKTANAYHRVGAIQGKLGRHSEAEAAYRRAMAIIEQLVAEEPLSHDYRRDLARIQANLGELLRHMGLTAEGEQLLRSAIASWGKLVGERPSVSQYQHELAQDNITLGRLLLESGERAEAASLFHQAIALLEKLVADAQSEPGYRDALATAHNDLGAMLIEEGRLEDAERSLRRAIELGEKLVADSPSVREYRNTLASRQHNLGALLTNMRRWPEGEHAYRQAIALNEKLAEDSPSILEYRDDLMLNNIALGAHVTAAGRRAEAEPPYRRAVALGERLVADFPSVPQYREHLAMSYSNLGSLLYEMGRQPEASPAIRQAIALEEKLVADSPSAPGYRYLLTMSQATLARVLWTAGNYKEAEHAFHRAITLVEQLAMESPAVLKYRSTLANLHSDLGLLLFRSGHPGESEQEYGRAISLLETLDDAASQNELAWVLATSPFLRLRDPHKALQSAKNALEQAPQAGGYWNTLGVAHYRVGDWNAAIKAFEKSMQLGAGGSASDWLFLAMAHWQKAEQVRAREWYDKAVQWMERNKNLSQ